uniref:Uncharacterized protein n=1 Tax=Solanum tuberosum TaxID=4113 RepID=M1CGX2_SOLTU
MNRSVPSKYIATHATMDSLSSKECYNSINYNVNQAASFQRKSHSNPKPTSFGYNHCSILDSSESDQGHAMSRQPRSKNDIISLYDMKNDITSLYDMSRQPRSKNAIISLYDMKNDITSLYDMSRYP